MVNFFLQDRANAKTVVYAIVNNCVDKGDITITTLGLGAQSASAFVQVFLAGTDSNASEIGDITLDLHERP